MGADLSIMTAVGTLQLLWKICFLLSPGIGSFSCLLRSLSLVSCSVNSNLFLMYRKGRQGLILGKEN